MTAVGRLLSTAWQTRYVAQGRLRAFGCDPASPSDLSAVLSLVRDELAAVKAAPTMPARERVVRLRVLHELVQQVVEVLR